MDSYPPMQAWNLKNFKLIYRTGFWNPHNFTELDDNPEYQEDWVAMSDLEARKKIDEVESDGIDNNNNGEIDERGEGGLFSSGIRQSYNILKYYEGAIITGEVKDENGTPMQNVRVTIVDEYEIPHDSVLTDENGFYNLIAPAGELKIIFSTGGWGKESNDIIRHRINQVEIDLLDTTNLTITDDQAMRLNQEWQIDDLDLTI
jgi:dolichyl-diphosphooligosaccharide--protein glycosyltransferase